MISEVGQRVLRDARLAPEVYKVCLAALSRPGRLFSSSPLWARLFLAWVDALALDRRDALLPAAVACECMAAGYDLVDAVYDGGHGPGAHTISMQDLTAGTTLLLLAQEVMGRLDAPAERRAGAGVILARAGRRALSGQLQDYALRRQRVATQDAVLAILRRRSGTLVAAPCQCAATLAGAHWRVVALAGRFGSALGCAAQLEDDLADRADDQRGGRKTVPAILAPLYPDDPNVADATTWALTRYFLQEAARVLARLSAYTSDARTEPLWTLLSPELDAA